jgi:hypothetical protein
VKHDRFIGLTVENQVQVLVLAVLRISVFFTRYPKLRFPRWLPGAVAVNPATKNRRFCEIPKHSIPLKGTSPSIQNMIRACDFDTNLTARRSL